MKCCAVENNQKPARGTSGLCPNCTATLVGFFIGDSTVKDWQKRYRKKYPEKIKARNAISHAIEAKKIPHPDVQLCHYCHEKRAEQYHHYFGYEPEDWFKIRPICIKCHKKIHEKKGIVYA